jgi:demethoxyubiquinone hydroxylase (CLK1/Coq7/Cat5 family)
MHKMKVIQQMTYQASKRPDLGAPSTAEEIHLSSVNQTLLESYEQPTIFNNITYKNKYRTNEKYIIEYEIFN